jgi:hypothetical protein
MVLPAGTVAWLGIVGFVLLAIVEPLAVSVQDALANKHDRLDALGWLTEPERLTVVEPANGEVHVSVTDCAAAGTISSGGEVPLVGAAIHVVGEELLFVYPASVLPLPAKLLAKLSVAAEAEYDHDWTPYRLLEVTLAGWLHVYDPAASADAGTTISAAQAATAARHPL